MGAHASGPCSGASPHGKSMGAHASGLCSGAFPHEERGCPHARVHACMPASERMDTGLLRCMKAAQRCFARACARARTPQARSVARIICEGVALQAPPCATLFCRPQRHACVCARVGGRGWGHTTHVGTNTREVRQVTLRSGCLADGTSFCKSYQSASYGLARLTSLAKLARSLLQSVTRGPAALYSVPIRSIDWLVAERGCESAAP